MTQPPMIVEILETNRLGAADCVTITGHPDISHIQLSTDYNRYSSQSPPPQSVPHVVFHLKRSLSASENARRAEKMEKQLTARTISYERCRTGAAIRLFNPQDLPTALSALEFDLSSQARLEGLFTEVCCAHREFMEDASSFPYVRFLLQAQKEASRGR